jgi:hypothetical protein
VFVFHAELLECQAQALSALADADFMWFSDFSSVGADHDERVIEVCGIREKTTARRIQCALKKAFPEWCCQRVWYKDFGIETGWEVWMYVPKAKMDRSR